MFACLNFKLAVIQALRNEELLEPFDKDEFWQKTFGKSYDDFAEYAYQNVPEVIEYYKKFKISKKLLHQVKNLLWLEFDVVYDINSQWDGEDNFFEITSLEGIENCPNLEKIDVALGLEPMPWEVKQWNLQKTYVSLKPLTKLKKLKEITLGGWVQDVESLLEIPFLQKLKIRENTQILEVEKKKFNLGEFREKVEKQGIKWV